MKGSGALARKAGGVEQSVSWNSIASRNSEIHIRCEGYYLAITVSIR